MAAGAEIDGERFARKVAQTVRRVRPLLTGLGSEVQGAALADLVSMWLAGHLVVADDSGIINTAETSKVREQILTHWLDTMRKLIPENEKVIVLRAKQ
jgi:hypothetical protein